MKTPVDRQATLTSLAMLKVHADSTNRQDYIDYFKPFVVYSLKKRNVYPVTRENVKEFLQEDFGLMIPVRGCELILKRLGRAGSLKKETGSYKLKKDLPQDDIETRRADAKRRATSIVNRLIKYAEEHHQIKLPEEQAEESIIRYLGGFSIQCLKSYSQDTALPEIGPSESRELTLVAFFIKDAYENDPGLFDDILLLVKGHMLSNAILCPDLESYQQSFKDVAFYLDTPIIIDLLGLHGKVEYDSASELLNLVGKLGGRFYIFTHVIDEVERVLKYSEAHFDDPNARNRVLSNIREQGMTGSDVTLVRSDLEGRLRTHGVSVINTPHYRIEHQIDEATLQQVLEESSKYKNPNARATDINSIRSIYVLRDNARPRSLESSKAVLVTPNPMLARAAYEFGKNYEESQEVSPVINEFSLGNIAWLKAPLESEDLPKFEIISSCYAVMQPSPGFWERFLAETEKLQKKGGISSSEHIFLRSDVRMTDELMSLTLGSEDALTEETISEAKTRVLGDLAKKKDAEIAKRDEMIRHLDQNRTTLIEDNQKRKKKITAIGNTFGRLAAATISIVLGVLVVSGILLPLVFSGNLAPVWRWILILSSTAVGLMAVGNLILGITVKTIYLRIKGSISQKVAGILLSLLGFHEVPKKINAEDKQERS